MFVCACVCVTSPMELEPDVFKNWVVCIMDAKMDFLDFTFLAFRSIDSILFLESAFAFDVVIFFAYWFSLPLPLFPRRESGEGSPALFR